jgi:hypothetical protein
MIRDKRAFIAVNAIGAAATLFALILWTISPPTHAIFPPWFLWMLEAFVFASFMYNIVRRLRGPIEPARWARGMTDKQLWITKGLFIVALIGITYAIVIWGVPRP